MYYYGARYYDPRISIFVSVDPLAEKYIGRSPYEYCFNNPINLIDPTGMGPDDFRVKSSGKKYVIETAIPTFEYQSSAQVASQIQNAYAKLNKTTSVGKNEETTSSSRYTAGELNSVGPGVNRVDEFSATERQIKMMEKTKIYNYFIQNGKLPPGNKFLDNYEICNSTILRYKI